MLVRRSVYEMDQEMCEKKIREGERRIRDGKREILEGKRELQKSKHEIKEGQDRLKEKEQHRQESLLNPRFLIGNKKKLRNHYGIFLIDLVRH